MSSRASVTHSKPPRVLMHSSLDALELHLDQLDTHLRRLIADIEGRAH